MDCISWMITTIEQYTGDAKLLHNLICGIVEDGSSRALKYQWTYDEKRFCFYLIDENKKIYTTVDELIIHYGLKNKDELVIRNSDKKYYLSYKNINENKLIQLLYYVHDIKSPFMSSSRSFKNMNDCWDWSDDEWLLWEMKNS